MPVFAHVPLILGPDKTRLSKRHGATSVIAYKEEGIVPEAFRNFLALLGWTPAGFAARDTARPRADRACLSLDGIQKSNAVFDRAKLDWFNTEYIRATPADAAAAADRRRVEESWAHSVPDESRSDGGDSSIC